MPIGCNIQVKVYSGKDKNETKMDRRESGETSVIFD